jgi:tetratricopeptide (TPR) repeat protein
MNDRLRNSCLLLLCLFFWQGQGETKTQAVVADQSNVTAGLSSADLQITTKSPAARAHFLEGVAKYQGLHRADAFVNWRKALQEDPNFALCHIYISLFSQDPLEQVAESEKALASRKFASREEQLVIDWLSASSKGQWIPAIQAMNEATHQYGEHKQILWLAGAWLARREQLQRALPLLERLTRMDPGFADAWNRTAYGYARTLQYDKAFVAMKRYTELLPNEPNPEDTSGEISRSAGRLEDALAHYRAALKIDPEFIDSQLGLADTYAVMGDEPRARVEYAIAIQKATKAQAVLWSMQSAATYVREGDYENADKAFQAAGRQAHESGFENLEAAACRQMAMYQSDGARAKQLLDEAAAILGGKHRVSTQVVNLELAEVLRTRIYRALQENDVPAAEAALKQLQDLAAGMSDANLDLISESATGSVLVARGKYQEAIPHLEEDLRNPYAMRSLVVAYEKTGNKEGASRVSRRLAAFSEPMLAQALVVAAFRKSMAATGN